jgi:hypothetical protein
VPELFQSTTFLPILRTGSAVSLGIAEYHSVFFGDSHSVASASGYLSVTRSDEEFGTKILCAFLLMRSGGPPQTTRRHLPQTHRYRVGWRVMTDFKMPHQGTKRGIYFSARL